MAPIASVSPETWPSILSLDMVEAKIPGPWVVRVGGCSEVTSRCEGGDGKATGWETAHRQGSRPGTEVRNLGLGHAGLAEWWVWGGQHPGESERSPSDREHQE